MTQGYPPILIVNSDAYGEGRVAVETFDGRKGNISLYFHTPSNATAGGHPAGRGAGWGDVVH